MCLDSLIPATYWMNTSQDTIIEDIINKNKRTVLPYLELLTRGAALQTRLNPHSVFKSLKDAGSLSDLWSLMFYSGYLTLEKQSPDGRVYWLKSPNHELNNYYREITERMIPSGML
jgi:hypothetical protein